MYFKKSKNSKTGRTYLYIADGFHDREKGYTKTITVQSLEYLDVLEKQYDDPVAHFTEVVKRMNEEKKEKNLSADCSFAQKIYFQIFKKSSRVFTSNRKITKAEGRRNVISNGAASIVDRVNNKRDKQTLKF